MANGNGNGNGKKPEWDDSLPLPAPKRLPKSIQDTLDSEEKLWEVMVDGKYV
jgi:hypothetical protein